jgi:hypothetical protein
MDERRRSAYLLNLSGSERDESCQRDAIDCPRRLESIAGSGCPLHLSAGETFSYIYFSCNLLPHYGFYKSEAMICRLTDGATGAVMQTPIVGLLSPGST